MAEGGGDEPEGINIVSEMTWQVGLAGLVKQHKFRSTLWSGKSCRTSAASAAAPLVEAQPVACGLPRLQSAGPTSLC